MHSTRTRLLGAFTLTLLIGAPAFAESEASRQSTSRAGTMNESHAATHNVSQSRSANHSQATSHARSVSKNQGTTGGFSRGTLSGPQPKQAPNPGTQSNNGAGVNPPNNGDAGNKGDTTR